MSHRLFQPLVGVFIAVLLVFGAVFGVALGKAPATALAQSTPTTQTQAKTKMHPLPPELAFLQNETPNQRFDSVVSGQVTFQNPQSQQVILNMVPGKVASIGSNSITITPNGSTQTRTFNVTSNTYIVSHPAAGSLSAFQNGERVMAFTIGNSSDAVAVVAPRGMMGWMH
ncbi:MAG: hypothetical protein ACRDIY_03475 [Chloroflexota bacterium]